MCFLNKLILPVVLLVALTANGVLTLAGWQAPSALDENRSMASQPQWSSDLNAYVRGLDAWITDTFAFRKPLVEAFNKTLYTRFESTFAPNVLIGEEPWIFGAAFDQQGSLAPRTLSPDYLAKVRETLIARKAWLKARGIDMLVMFFPTKEKIYGNRFLPERWHFDETLRSEAEQVYDVLKDVMPDSIVSIRQALADASETQEVYYHTDSHATQYGSFVAYEQLAAHLRRYFPDKAAADYPAYTLKLDALEPTAYGRLMGIPFRDFSLVPLPDEGYRAVSSGPVPAAEFIPAGASVEYRRNDQANDVRLVVVGDSFTGRMVNIFGEVFGESVTLAMNHTANRPEDRFPYAFLDAYRPDLVVMIYVESRLLECSQDCGQFPLGYPQDRP